MSLWFHGHSEDVMTQCIINKDRRIKKLTLICFEIVDFLIDCGNFREHSGALKGINVALRALFDIQFTVLNEN